MVVVIRLRPGPQRADLMREEAERVLDLWSQRPGFRSGQLGRALDDPGQWALVTEWESVGAYRRALSGWEMKAVLGTLQADMVTEPSAYEVVSRR